MADQSSDSFDAGLADLPFTIMPALLNSAFVSPNLVETLNNAEQFMVIKDYRTSAMLYTVALRRLEPGSSPGLVAAILCKRAECLLCLNYVQHALRDCRDAKSKVGGENEHIAFLSSKALELQGEVKKAFLHAVIYQSLDPLMPRDKDVVRRLRAKVKWLCGQGYHQVNSTLDVLMTQGKLSLSNSETKVALAFFTEVVNLFQGIPEAHEYRAQCLFILGDYVQAERDCNTALKLTQRTSTAAFDTKIKIKIQLEEFTEALKLVNEWRMVDPENSDVGLIKKEVREKMAAAQPRAGTAKMNRCQSLSDVSCGHESGRESTSESTTKTMIHHQSGSAKPKNKKDLQREERQRERERQEIARELEERRKQEESKRRKVIAHAEGREEQQGACEKAKGAAATEDISPSMASLAALPGERPSFPERSRKRRTRRKTRALRTAREGLNDDSDASSVCSISTCPGDLEYRTNYRPRMPTFEDSDQGIVSDQPISSAHQTKKAAEKSSNKQSLGIRQRPPGVQGPYRLCRYHDRRELCWQGKLCVYAHNEAERVAWEEDRIKENSRKLIAKKEEAKRLKEWHHAFRGQCRAPWHIPKKGGKYKMCPKWANGTCKLQRACTFAHGEKELEAWNEHLEKMEKERKMKTEAGKEEKTTGGRPESSSNKLDDVFAVTVDPCVSKAATKLDRQSNGIRPRPENVYGAFRLCSHYSVRKRCPAGDQCSFPHSEVERIAWEEDRKKGSFKPAAPKDSSKQQKVKGASSMSLREWRYAFRGPTGCRAPLRIPNNGKKYRMCPEWTKGSCKLGRVCTFAHGETELTAWNNHLEKMDSELKTRTMKQKNVDSAEESKVSSLVEVERPTPTYKVEDLVSLLPGVNVTCEPRDLDVLLQVPLNSEGENRYGWSLQICYEPSAAGKLQDVVLLPQHHRCYTLSSVNFSCAVTDVSAASTTLKPPDSEELPDMFHYPVKSYLHELHGSCEVEVVVLFSSRVFGYFSQVLVLDFGKEKHLAVKMSIEVGSQKFLQEFGEAKTNLTLDWPLWDDGSRKIVKFEPKRPSVFNNEHLVAKYKLPKREDIVPSTLLDGSKGLSKDNYKDVMHQLLFVEEFYIRQQIASFNVQGVNLYATQLLVKTDEVLCAEEGWLYGSFHVSHPVTPDDANGRLLLRNLFGSVGSVLIAKTQSPNSVVYEALVHSVEDSRVILKLSSRCCEDLGLSNNGDVRVDVQFHINRLPLCEMHDNIDRLGPEHVRILFPEFSSVGLEEKIYHLPWILDPNLNEDQKEIIRKIAAPSIDAPPLVVFGPFGTGKTFTLHQAVRRIAVNLNNRVLICTHSNSAADMHVELLDEYLREQSGITACRPLRIYTPMRKLSTVSDKVRQYCLVTDKGKPTEAFRLPTRHEVLSHRVVVSTLGMSRALFDMELHRGFFSHILIDEAAQALETETLTPVTLAGNNTKVVFTGDHMQMSPDVFSPQAAKWGYQISLQERLFHDYKKRRKEKTLDPNLILLTENYRSNEQVLQFSSDMFYGGRLSSGSKQPLHPVLGPLVFYSALGKEEIEKNHSSYRNLAEVNEVVKRVKELTDSWPNAEWGPRDLKQVAVVSSYRYQVRTIRDGLRKVGLGQVDVETIENVQGKQFRALFISTVRTFHTCKEFRERDLADSESPYLYFLSDPKLLNTAVTRAQSFIAVVGDPFSLRTVGACQGLWEEFIKRCSDQGSLFGIKPNELEEGISQSGLNVNATEFVPGEFSNTIHPAAKNEDRGLNGTASGMPPSSPQEFKSEFKTGDRTFLSKGKSHSSEDDDTALTDLENVDEIEPARASDSDDAGDELSESDDVGNADDFAEYGNMDDTVPPESMDEIILALKAKCEENKMKRKAKEGTKEEKHDARPHVPAVDDAKNTKSPLTSPSGFNVVGKNVVHEDYKMTTRKGETHIFLVNMKVKYSERTERLIREPKQKEQECLQPEYLDRLLREDPQLYRTCSLHINHERSRTLYGEIQDTGTEDILIQGNTRKYFERDRVVVKLTNLPSSSSERMKGEILGIWNRPISLRELQFVCTINRNNPGLMCPINRSMTPIGNLRDESCRGVPIYKRVHPGSAEKAVRVGTLSLREALSGKYLFVVQYLQWKREFPYPLGIVTKKIRRTSDLSEAYKLLATEYQLKEYFPEEVDKEVERQIGEWSSIPNRERNSRQRVTNAFTIDPPGSKALDDALTSEELENGHCKVGVHIADVSYFVTKGSRIDTEARKRGTSYFRGHGFGDILMLPKHLSHCVCSLLPNQERLAVSVYLVLDQDGREQEEIEFCRTVVRSQCRFTYTEAQRVILGERIRDKPLTDGEVTPVIEQSIRTLSFLAQKRRQLRLSDKSFYHFDNADRKEDLEAHELVEEMMILANTSVARYLVRRQSVLSAPLRIQLPPKRRKLDEWIERFGEFAMLSLSLRTHLRQDGHCTESFVVPASTWNYINNALRRQDHRGLMHLLCNDNIYPQLAVARSQLNGLQRKAEDVRAAEVEEDHRVHWSLNVKEYTRFTSPIRRYLDIEVHRLLLENEEQKTAPEDLAELYGRCSFLSDRSSMFERDCGQVQFAADLKENTCETAAVVEVITLDFIQIQPLSDANQYLTTKQMRVKISDLGPIKQPKLDESLTSVKLEWKFRVYDASTENMERARQLRDQERHLREDRRKIESLLYDVLSRSSLDYHIPSGHWREVLDAVKKSDFERVKQCLEKVDKCIVSERERAFQERQTEQEEKDDDDDWSDDEESDDEDDDEGDDYDEVMYDFDESDSESDTDSFKDDLHFIKVTRALKVSDNVSVQLSANDIGPLMTPDIQLFNLAPGINICLEHRKLSDKCFAETASEKASKQRYRDIMAYANAWTPLLNMEAATNSISNDDAFVLQDIEVKWKENGDCQLVGEFHLDKTFSETRQIEIFHGDYACVRVSCSASPSRSLTPGEKAVERFWVGHCIFTGAGTSLKFKLKLFQHSTSIPQVLRSGGTRRCIVEIIKQTIPSRRMIKTLEDLPSKGTRLAHDICLGNATRLEGLHIRLPADNLSVAAQVEECDLQRLNTNQETAVKRSLRGRFTLIQGPPGTGKTITGVHIAFWFAEMNKRNTLPEGTTPTEEIPISKKAPPQVLYCGPSNKSVDVVADYLMRIKGINILRVYGNFIEQKRFPIPNQIQPTRPIASEQELRIPKNLRRIALHYVIRDEETSPYANKLRRLESLFAAKKKKKEKVEEVLVEEYLAIITEAEKWAIQSSRNGEYVQIVLCTCSSAGSKRIREACNNVMQCIVDECGMCMEPETLIPIVYSKAQQVVLIGDHMQLQPIVKNRLSRSLGLRTSMFERFSDHTFMLKEQYRMHPDICEFPSKQFYKDELVTPQSVINRDRGKWRRRLINFWPSHNDTDFVPLVFCNVVGEEEELVVTTEEGNQRSKSNLTERDKVVEVVDKLVRHCGVGMDQIAVLSPYRAQCHVIREDLTDRELSGVPVISIVKSQGSEFDFVILSLVRSLPDSQINSEPDGGWLKENLGFVTDEHQINVALTRAKRGLVVIGNKNLLEVCEMWSYLIDHYQEKACFVESGGWP